MTEKQQTGTDPGPAPQDESLSSTVASELNSKLEGHFPASPYDYTSAAALILYWKDADHEGFQTEAKDMWALFTEDFGYKAEIFAIPTLKSHLAVDNAISKFLIENETSKSLLIIVYGGHGDRDDDRRAGQQQRSVWAVWHEGGPSVAWWKIQPKLVDAESDVLLIFDCCFAAQAGRDRTSPDEPRRCELLAAAAMGVSTAPPGSKSFTTILMKETRKMLRERGEVVITHLHGELVKAPVNTMETAVHIDLKGRSKKRGIRLQPLTKSADPPGAPRTDSLTSLTLRVSVQGALDAGALSDIATWLKSEVPPTISGLEVQQVVETTKKLHDFVFEESGAKKPIFGRLSEQGQSDVLQYWGPLSSLLSIQRASWSYLPSLNLINTVQRQAETVFSQLKALNTNVLQSVQRNVLALPESYNEAQVAELAKDEDAKAIGLAEPLLIRREIVTEDRPKNLCISAKAVQIIPTEDQSFDFGQLSDGTKVLVEYKTYDQRDRDPSRWGRVYEDRIQNLTALLSIPSTASFGSLRCLKYFEETEKCYFGLVFEVPSDYRAPTSLRTIIKTASKEAKPSLGQRFKIAYSLARAVEQWHSVDWVHQGISSPNVVFFEREGLDATDYGLPFLAGFDYARPNMAPSVLRKVEDFDHNVYRHPARHGVPTERFSKEHDLYSFGVLLLEIGLWMPVQELFSKSTRNGEQPISPLEVRSKLVRSVNRQLAHCMGKSYKSATLTCLSGSFGVESDDKAQSLLGKAYHEKVVDALALGLNLG